MMVQAVESHGVGKVTRPFNKLKAPGKGFLLDSLASHFSQAQLLGTLPFQKGSKRGKC